MLNKYQESMAIARDCDHPSVTITFTANSLTSRKEIGAKLYKLLKAEHRDPELVEQVPPRWMAENTPERVCKWKLRIFGKVFGACLRATADMPVPLPCAPDLLLLHSVQSRLRLRPSRGRCRTAAPFATFLAKQMRVVARLPIEEDRQRLLRNLQAVERDKTPSGLEALSLDRRGAEGDRPLRGNVAEVVWRRDSPEEHVVTQEKVQAGSGSRPSVPSLMLLPAGSRIGQAGNLSIDDAAGEAVEEQALSSLAPLTPAGLQKHLHGNLGLPDVDDHAHLSP
ncbi:hypothetical protein VTN31DRAFT_7382 [Thermomyces dupontii]|uniref:uncharacterized protein n=1 Tax=Talaromyces thermophilus TaxID=28565 RepID=UPI0037425E46